MDTIKVGKYTVTGRMADNVTEEEKENSLRLLKSAIWQQIQLDKKK